MVGHLVLALIMVVQYHTDLDSTGIVLHVLKGLQPAVLDTDTVCITNIILFLVFCVCACCTMSQYW